MYISTTIIILFSLNNVLGQYSQDNNIQKWFENINNDVIKYNAMAAEIAWESSINPGNPTLARKAAEYQKQRMSWQNHICDMLATLREGHLLNDTQTRQSYLLCRGPLFTFDEARKSSDLYEDLQSIYTDSRICIPTSSVVSTENITEVEDAILDYLSKYTNVTVAVKIAAIEENERNHILCLRGDPDLEKLMAFSRNDRVLKWTWLVWREKIGPPMKEPYLQLVDIENRAARRNGYNDIGESWRDELEISDLRQYCLRLYSQIRPLYTLLHGVTRYYLRRLYGHIVPERGAIPAHLLGNMWSQNWEPLIDLIHPNTINLDGSIQKANWTILHMVKRAEDFYQSLGLPAMTEQFWRESVFSRESNDDTRCHGAAADMFKNGDYRLLYCSRRSMDDFYVLHHEMGHIQYYMAYEEQPGIFRQGANSAFQESIGDAIMYGVLTPQHLHRLGLVNDSFLYVNSANNLEELNENIEVNNVNGQINNDQDVAKEKEDLEISHDELFLLKQGLNKIPQIPFALLVDEYRWKLFEGNINGDGINKDFWNLVQELQGIAPPDGARGEKYFDIGAKYHVPDNTPYIRYFLSSFLQVQIFESLCKAAVFGRQALNKQLPDTMSLNRCDIYGSKAAGKVLRDIISKGSSTHWRSILRSATGTDDISTSALELYYQPLKKLLMLLVRKHQIPIGW